MARKCVKHIHVHPNNTLIILDPKGESGVNKSKPWWFCDPRSSIYVISIFVNFLHMPFYCKSNSLSQISNQVLRYVKKIFNVQKLLLLVEASEISIF